LTGASGKISALYEIEQDGKIIERQRLSLSNENHLFKIPIKEEYRGNIAAHYTVIKDSRLYQETVNISVPYTNKQLDIRFETFRNKLQPGQQEEWKIRVAGKKAEKVMAEMVATCTMPHSMYSVRITGMLISTAHCMPACSGTV
jgi:hypothetical protein